MPKDPITPSPIRIRVDHRALRRAVIVVIVVLYVINIPASASVHSAEGFDFDHPVWRWVLLKSERNIPTLYACVQLAACAGLAVLHGMLTRAERSSGTLRWMGMALVFGYLTLDEGLGIHERFGPLADRLVPGAGDLEFGWIVIAAIGVIPLVIAYLPWILRLPVWVRNGLLAGGAIYVLGAFGFQSISGGLRFAHPWFPFWAGLEELAELSGIAVFGLTLLQYLTRRLDDRPVLVTSTGGAAQARARSATPTPGSG